MAVWTGREMIVWASTGDTSGGRYDPGTDTWKPMSTVNAPSPRFHDVAVWTGKEMIVWGGLDDNSVFHNDGGRYNPRTNSWLRTTTLNVPSARGLHYAAPPRLHLQPSGKQPPTAVPVGLRRDNRLRQPRSYSVH